MLQKTKLYLKSGYKFKIYYSHNYYQLVSIPNDEFNTFHMFGVKDDDSTVYIGKVKITGKYLRLEHNFEGLTFYDKYAVNELKIIHPPKAD